MLAPTARAAPHSKTTLRCAAGAIADPVADALIIRRLATILDGEAAVAFVWPLGGEPDLRSLMTERDRAGRLVALPVIDGPGRPLSFRRWRADAAMQAGPLGTRHPAPDQPSVSPGIILVPMLAFDRRRNRLGRGGGFYDRTLAHYPSARAVGFAYAAAEIAAVPTEPHDRPLDIIVTDRESL